MTVKKIVCELVKTTSVATREGGALKISLSVPYDGHGLSQENIGFLTANVGNNFLVDLTLDGTPDIVKVNDDADEVVLF